MNNSRKLTFNFIHNAGQWTQGYRQGHGTYKYPNGDIYVGEWFRNCKNGHGVYNEKMTGVKVNIKVHSLLCAT